MPTESHGLRWKKVFRDPPRDRNRVWQTNLSGFETIAGGSWRICAVVDYAIKYCLAVHGHTHLAQ